MFGRVLWFDSEKGYGFLKGDDGNERFFHHTDILMDGYKYTYSGTPVEFTTGLNKNGEEAAFNIKQLERLSPNGKIMIMVSFLELNEDTTLTHFNFDIASKAESGIKFIKMIDKYIVCTNKKVGYYQLLVIKRILDDGVKLNCPILTDTEYDYIFI